MITPEAMRQLADCLEKPQGTFINRMDTIHPTLFEAAGMLRSIAAERDAEAKRNDVKQMREYYIFEYEQEHGKGSFDATGE